MAKIGVNVTGGMEIYQPFFANIYVLIEEKYNNDRNQTPLKSQLQVLSSQCSEEEARVLIPVIESLLSALRGSTNESL